MLWAIGILSAIVLLETAYVGSTFRKDNTDAIVEAMAANTEASLAPLTLELQNVATVLDEARLDRHCTPPAPGQVDAQYLWCLAANCWDKQLSKGQTGSKTCGDIEALANALTRCELQTDPTVRSACIEKLTPK